jgi:rubrerythrin
MTGVYRVKNADMRVLFEEAQQIIKRFKSVKFQHNLRHRNELADKLANLAMDKKAEVTDVDHIDASVKETKPLPIDEPSAVAPKAGDVWSCTRCGCILEIKRPSNVRPHQLKPFTCQCGQKMTGSTTSPA